MDGAEPPRPPGRAVLRTPGIPPALGQFAPRRAAGRPPARRGPKPSEWEGSMLKLLLGAAVAAGAYYWFVARRSDTAVDRLREAAGGAGDALAGAAGAARSAAEEAAGRARDAARS